MFMICTSPCQPQCDQEAVWMLFSQNGVELGYNCEVHIPKKFLLNEKSAKDYKIAPLHDKIEELI